MKLWKLHAIGVVLILVGWPIIFAGFNWVADGRLYLSDFDRGMVIGAVGLSIGMTLISWLCSWEA